jgi:prepilin signal peptidase PulO-like enzyme (type II secretory pathway)
MLIIIVTLLGLCFGSFINALVWRIHMQEELEDRRSELAKKNRSKVSNSKLQNPNYSLFNGRSMCPGCHHKLAAKDLVPLISWLNLKGKCRYCHKPISRQYPAVELITALLFVASWIFWPNELTNAWQYIGFVSWLIILIGLIALAVYDIKWMIIPDRIIYPLIGVAAVTVIIQIFLGRPLTDLAGIALAAVIGGGIFWIIYQISKGKWIGGGDIKLGFLLGIIVGKPEYAFILLFLASLIALIFVAPLLAIKKLKNNSKIPFGPFLIAASIIVVLFGSTILDFYKRLSGL